MDSRSRRNLNQLNNELQDVQKIMVQNIDDVLQRGIAISGSFVYQLYLIVANVAPFPFIRAWQQSNKPVCTVTEVQKGRSLLEFTGDLCEDCIRRRHRPGHLPLLLGPLIKLPHYTKYILFIYISTRPFPVFIITD